MAVDLVKLQGRQLKSGWEKEEARKKFFFIRLFNYDCLPECSNHSGFFIISNMFGDLLHQEGGPILAGT
jgi:hypothetical protein